MSAFYEVRTARKTYRCDGDPYPAGCAGPIRPGDRHVIAKATPYHDGLGNQGWWTLRYCLICAEDYDQTKAALREAAG